MIPISALYVQCSYPMRPDAIAASDNCNRPATSAVIQPGTGFRLWRCDRHSGQLDEGMPGEVITEIKG